MYLLSRPPDLSQKEKAGVNFPTNSPETKEDEAFASVVTPNPVG